MKKVKIGCDVCGAGKLANIRGKHPGDPRREVCPTCLQEYFERVQEYLEKDSGAAFIDKLKELR